MAYAVRFTPQAAEHLRSLRRFDQVRLRDPIVRHLTDRPTDETRNKKELESESLGTRELRVGDFRVFYDVAQDNNEVVIVAIGVKEHDRLFIAGEEVDL
jgi:mRNA-degrading endonuclease RelE of RelBE toxin-antitoxin system